MLGRYTDLIEGQDHRAATVMSECFDQVGEPVTQHPDRPPQMVGGDSKNQTLTNISANEGPFSPNQIHPRLRTLLKTLAGSLTFFLQVRSATSELRNARVAAPVTQQVARAETEAVDEVADYFQEELKDHQRKYDQLTRDRNEQPVFRYRTVIRALELAYREFDAATGKFMSDRRFSTDGVVRGAKVLGDRFPKSFKRGMGTVLAPESGRKSGSKRSASELDHDGANDEDKRKSDSRGPAAKKSLLSKPAIAEGVDE